MQIRDRIKELRRVPASSLKPNPKNWRTHPQAQQDALRGVLAEVGIADAVLARELPDGSLMLVDGHLRAETITDAEVPVLVLDVDESEADKILATLDPLAAMAEADANKLDALLREVQTGNEALADMLTDLAEESGVLDEDEKEIVEDEAPEPPVVPITKPGDLWLLGRHRLLCGDSTKAEDVERLMAGAKADLCFTSPPYNLGNNHHTGEKNTQAYFDDLPEGDYRKQQQTVLDIVAKICRGDCFYQHKNRIKRGEWLTPVDWIRTDVWRIVQEVVWINGGPNMDPRRFYPQTERIYWLTRDDTATSFSNVDRLTDWWQVAPVGTNAEHTRSFPVELPSRILRATQAASVYEPFCGSGTTLIAAEQINRTCYGMEISPQYCDVIVKRWENLTGQKATLEKPKKR